MCLLLNTAVGSLDGGGDICKGSANIACPDDADLVQLGHHVALTQSPRHHVPRGNSTTWRASDHETAALG